MQSSSTENSSSDKRDGEDEIISSNEIQNNKQNKQECSNNYENTSFT